MTVGDFPKTSFSIFSDWFLRFLMGFVMKIKKKETERKSI